MFLLLLLLQESTVVAEVVGRENASKRQTPVARTESGLFFAMSLSPTMLVAVCEHVQRRLHGRKENLFSHR